MNSHGYHYGTGVRSYLSTQMCDQVLVTVWRPLGEYAYCRGIKCGKAPETVPAVTQNAKYHNFN